MQPSLSGPIPVSYTHLDVYKRQKDNWEVMSQKTKKELIDEKVLIAKLEHNQNWKRNIAGVFKKLGIINENREGN